VRKLFLLWILLVIGTGVNAQEEGEVFTLYGDQPVVRHGAFGEWDGRYTDPGAVLFHEGKFHMFRNGFQAWPASVQIGYLTSEDGLNWTEVSEAPVMMTDDVPYAEVAALASDALVLDDGTWVLYLYIWNSTPSTPAPGTIARATAPSPTGPWTPDPEPILNPGSEGSWDAGNVDAPRLVQTDDGYIMYYTGYDLNGLSSGKIGMATSPDGIAWTKYDDPTTTDAPYAESDPILTAPEGITLVNQPMVEITDAGWTMVFRQVDFSVRPPQMSLNYALSDDGIHWEIASDTPFWTRTTVPRSGGFWYTALEHHDDTYYLYVETGIGSGTDIFAATHDGALAD
jgi:predicted GH43/DUF377 family glycosyl hydrolase